MAELTAADRAAAQKVLHDLAEWITVEYGFDPPAEKVVAAALAAVRAEVKQMPEAPTMEDAAAVSRACWHTDNDGLACTWCILIALGEVRAAEGQRAYEEWQRAEALQARVAALEAAYMDEQGVTWTVPTAEAYAKVCRARDTLQARVAALEAELTEQWESNHAEHCGQMPNVHDGRCEWPKPAVLTP